MKLNSLRQLVKEELKKVLSENTEDVKDVFPTEPGAYQIDYVITNDAGEPDNTESDTVIISQRDIEMDRNVPPRRFWETKPRSSSKVYKVDKVTKVG